MATPQDPTHIRLAVMIPHKPTIQATSGGGVELFQPPGPLLAPLLLGMLLRLSQLLQ
jgi:hypothetical protein